MKAVWYERTGAAPDVLTVGEQPEPQAGPGEVRGRLHASGVNPAHCNRRGGRGYLMEDPRVVPNSDGAGMVDQTGPGADPGLLGKRVWLYNGQRGRAFGTAAEFIALDEELVSPLPDDVGFIEGACLGIPCMTAWHCVFMDGPVSGRTVLVQGGAGAVGHFAVQLAVWGGARVLATVDGEPKSRHALAGGAAATIDFRHDDVADRVLELTAGAGVDRIVEVDFGGNLSADLKNAEAERRDRRLRFARRRRAPAAVLRSAAQEHHRARGAAARHARRQPQGGAAGGGRLAAWGKRAHQRFPGVRSGRYRTGSSRGGSGDQARHGGRQVRRVTTAYAIFTYSKSPG